MRRGIPRVLAFLACLMVTSFVEAGSLRPQVRTPKPTVVLAERVGVHKVRYNIDSKIVGSEPDIDLLHELSEIYEARGKDQPVIFLVDSRLPIDLVSNLQGTAWKAQLENLR